MPEEMFLVLLPRCPGESQMATPTGRGELYIRPLVFGGDNPWVALPRIHILGVRVPVGPTSRI